MDSETNKDGKDKANWQVCEAAGLLRIGTTSPKGILAEYIKMGNEQTRSPTNPISRHLS